MPTRVQIAKPDIVAALDALSKRVFTQSELASMLAQNRDGWRLAQRFGRLDFVNFLIQKSKLKRIVLKTQQNQELERFSWGGASPYEIALSLNQGSYLSHGTAVFLHALNDQLPGIIYTNHEQSPKPRSEGALTQSAIHQAFANPQRQSSSIYTFDSQRVQVINGKYTGHLEVGRVLDSSGRMVEVTKLERTLIDISVRSAYAGGPFQVLEAFKRAKPRISVNTLVATLQSLHFIYPYHQAIGFYMERAGFEKERLRKIRDFGNHFDFYLAHGLIEKQFDPAWRLYYPPGF